MEEGQPLSLSLSLCSSPLSDRAGRMLPGALSRRALAGLRAQPLRVLPVQGAGQLPVRLLRGPVAHQHGQAQRGTPAAQLPLGVQRHLRLPQLFPGELRAPRHLQAAQPQDG